MYSDPGESTSVDCKVRGGSRPCLAVAWGSSVMRTMHRILTVHCEDKVLLCVCVSVMQERGGHRSEMKSPRSPRVGELKHLSAASVSQVCFHSWFSKAKRYLSFIFLSRDRSSVLVHSTDARGSQD